MSRLIARSWPVLPFRPGLGTGIQRTRGRKQEYTVFNRFTVERFCVTENEAYVVLQEALDQREAS